MDKPRAKRIRSGRHLTPTDQVLVGKMADKGLKQSLIAQTLDCGQATISRTLAKRDSTKQQAIEYLDAEAHTFAQRIVKHANVQESIKMLEKLDVVRSDEQKPSSVQIVLGVAPVFGMPNNSLP